MAEDFLRRFITLFDTDRSELEMGYSNDAILSCRVPSTQPESSADTPVPSYASTLTVHIGRAEITDKLNRLIGYHFSRRRIRQHDKLRHRRSFTGSDQLWSRLH